MNASITSYIVVCMYMNARITAYVVLCRYISSGWEVIPASQERVPFLDIWHGMCPYLQICYRKSPEAAARPAPLHRNHVALEMNLCLETYQVTYNY